METSQANSMSQNIDQQVLRSFQQEVRAALPELKRHLGKLAEDPDRRDALRKAHKLVQGLSGVASLLGLANWSEPGSAVGHFLDEVVSGTQTMTAETAQELQGALELIETELNAPEGLEPPQFELAELEDEISLDAPPPDLMHEAEDELRFELLDVEEPDFLQADDAQQDAGMNELPLDEPADAELMEVFQEEAEEHLAVIASSLRDLSDDQTNAEALRNVRRSMHTIKGAAGMVGLRTAQRIAHRSEDLLDQLSESNATPDPAIVPLLQATADLIQDITSAQGADDDVRRAVNELCAQYDGMAVQPAAAPLEEAAPEPSFENPAPAATETLEEDAPAGGELLEVFQEEAEEHLGLIAKNLRTLRETPGAIDVLQEVRRSMHTIKGAAGMVGLRSAQRVAHRSEDLLDVLHEAGATLDSAVLDLIQASADLIQTVTEAKGADEAGRQRALELSARYDEFLQAAQTEEAELAEDSVEALTPEVPEIAVVPVPAPPPAVPAMPPASKSFDASKSPSGQYARVPLERVEELVRLVSELIVSRSNFEQHCRRFTRESGELKLSGERITQLTGKLEADYAVKAMAERSDAAGSPLAYAGGASAGSFDSLEFDRYSEFHLLSRDLNEAAADISSAGTHLHGVAGEFQNSLVRLSRLTGEVQDGLMRLRMAPVASLENRLHRTVRVAAQACNKKVRLEVIGADVELDKSVLEEITGPLEHLLRNAVDHGIESPAKRAAAGKPEEGVVTLRAYLEGARAAIEVRDDGAGLDVEALRAKAIERGIHSQRSAGELTQDETFELICHAGFTTAAKVSEVSGRGVGMDVVRSAIESLNGSIGIQSERGVGSAFLIGLPTSLAVARVLMVQANSQVFAAPMHSVRQVIKLHPRDVSSTPQGEYVDFDGKRYKAVRLADALNLPGEPDPEPDRLAAMVIDAGKRSFVLLADDILEAAEVVVKNMGGLLRRVHGISAATIAGDGSVVLILNPGQLVDEPPAEFRRDQMETRDEINDQQLKILIVDDSLSVRRVVTRLLETNDWITVAARDGMEALEALKEMPAPPDAILCDVEMPRMDGYELASTLKSGAFAQIPILMLTSRAGKKHRDRAAEIGVYDYLIKPFQDEALLTAIRSAVDAAKHA